MAAWSYRIRSARRRRSFKSGYDIDEDRISLDFTKEPSENLSEILTKLTEFPRQEKHARLNYLSAFVNLCQKCGPLQNVSFSSQQVLCCLRMTIVHESKEVRAAGLRAIRYYLHDERSVDIFLALHIDLLMCRCIDIVLDNQIERIQALKVIRKIIKVCPMKVTPALVNCITSLANDECQGQEKLIRACLSIISELVVVNTEICAESGCLGVLIHKILDTQQPWINEAMIGVIIYLINLEHTRILIRKCVKVEQILAPFTDLHYRHTIDTNENSLIDDRNIRQTASKLALLSVLCSWPGLIWFSQFDGSNDGVQSLINVLYLDDVDTQIRVMDIMFELFRIPIPESTEDFSSALLSIDPSNHRESWELYKGFVAQEGKDILRNRSKFRMNLVDNYIAVLLMSFVKFGVLDTLVELITKSCLRVCIRATILLAELLYLTCRLLPAECCRHFQALPTLLSLATSLDIPKEQRQQASNAISYLSMVHDLKKRHPVPYSLYLDQQIRFCKNASRRHRSHRPSIGELIRNTKLDSYVKVSDDYINQSIKDSLVLSHRDSSSWDWNIISNTVFKYPTDTFKRLEDVNHKLFVRKILNFYKPSSNIYCSKSLTRDHSLVYTSSGFDLIRFLLDSEEGGEGNKVLDELMKDIANHLAEVTTRKYTAESVFSPNKVMKTMSQQYFLFFGKLSSTSRGCKVMEKSGLFQLLLELVDNNIHSCYSKLIASSMDYTKPVFSRILLNKILTSSCEESRLYGVKMMVVLLRAKLPDFHKWVIELLVAQLYDKSNLVSSTALAILDEACDDPVNLEALIEMRPSLLHLGDQGLLLLIRFLSLPNGFKFLRDANFIQHQLDKWETGFMLKYVDIVESKLNQSLTRHQLDERGSYGRYSSENQYEIDDVFVPPHLYGQLSQHAVGFSLLVQQTKLLQKLFTTLQEANVQDLQQIRHLKAALWALGHVGTSVAGISLLNEQEVIPDIVKLAEESSVFSIRGTCFYVIGLLSSTSVGSNLLGQVGWRSKRQHRLEKWPIIVQDNTFCDGLSEDCLRHYSSSSSGTESRTNSESVCVQCRDQFNANLSNVTSFKFDSSSNRTLMSKWGRDRSLSSGQFSDAGQSIVKPRCSSGCTCAHSGVNCNFDGDIHSGKSQNESLTKVPNVNASTYDANKFLSGSVCNVLHIRASSISTSASSIGDNVTDSSVTKERSRSLSENKTDNKKVIDIVKGDSDTKLQQYLSGNSDWIDASHITRVIKNSNDKDGAEHIDDAQLIKLRSSSCTESTTSGVSSCDSVVVSRNNNGTLSDGSMILSEEGSLHIGNNIEYLDKVRKRSNLRHTPKIIIQRSISQVCNVSPLSSTSLENNIFNFPSPKDTVGYNTLKRLQNYGNRSSIIDGDSRSGRFSSYSEYKFRLSRMQKSQSLEDDFYQRSHGSTTSSASSSSELCKADLDDVRYMGICLPIDASMIFSIYDAPCGGDTSCNISEDIQCNDGTKNDSQSVVQNSCSSGRQHDTGLAFHTPVKCIGCYRISSRTGSFSKTSNAHHKILSLPIPDVDGDVSSSVPGLPSHNSPHLTNQNLPNTPVTSQVGSCTSTSSADIGLLSSDVISSKLPSLRKEVIRVVINLSSSLAVKSSEQSLLNLKQKYPNLFNDLCLYSEISYMMSLYRFRFSARKFLQELFMDAQFDALFEEAEKMISAK